MRPFLSLAALALLLAGGLVVSRVLGDDEKKEKDPNLVVALKGHKEAVYGVAFSPDGKHLLTASGEPSIKVFLIATGKEIKSFGGPNGHKQNVLGVAMSPDGSQFATAGQDNSAKVWDFPTNKHQREYAVSDESRAVAASPDNTKLACGSKDGKVRVYNVADSKQVYEVAAHTGAVTGLAYNGNGTVLVSVGVDGMLRYWNAPDGKALGSFGAHAGEITGVAHAPTGTNVYTAGKDGSVRYWGQLTASRGLAAALKDGVTSLTLSADGTQILVGADKVVRVSALSNGATTRELTGATGTVTSTAFHPQATYVAAGTSDRRVLVWQTKDNQLVSSTVAHGSAVTGLAFNAGGTQLATTGKDGLVRVWTMPPNAPRKLTPGDVVRVAVVSPDGKRLATGGADKTIRLYKLDKLDAPERQMTGSTAAVNVIAISSDAKGMASGGDDEVIRFWDQNKGDQTALIGAHAGPVTSLFYVGTTQVLSASNDGTVKLWQVPAALTKNNFAHAGVVTSAVLSPDGTKLLTGCDDKQVRLWNLGSGQAERTWTGPTLAIGCVAFSSKGDRVAAGSADKSVTVWESGGNKEVKKFTGLSSAPRALALTADGKHVVAGLTDGAVKVLDLATGKEANTFTGHKGAVNYLNFTPKGELIYAGEEGTVIVRSLTGKDATLTWKHGEAIRAVALSKDGAKAAVGSGKTVKTYAAATGKVEANLATPAEVRDLAYSGDGKKLAVAGADGKTRIYSVEGSLEEYFTQEGAVNAVVFSSDSKRVMTAGADKTARVWATSLVWQAKHEGGVKRAMVSPRGDRILSAGTDGVVRVWGVADGKTTQSFRAHAGAVTGLAVSADVTRIVTAGADRTARVWDWSKMAPNNVAAKEVEKSVLQMPLSAAAETLSLSPDGKRIAVGIAGQKAGQDRVPIFDAATGKELITLGDPDGLAGRNLTFLSDSRTLLSAGEDKTVSLIDVNVVASYEAHAGGAVDVAFHSNGTQILTAGADKTAKLWTFATGKLERTFGPLGEAVTSAGFSRDFAQVAATAGKTLKVWTVTDGKEAASIDMPQPAVSLSFNANKSQIATANSDGKARVWDVAAKAEAQSFVHTGAVTGVAFHPTTATLLISGGADKTVGIHTTSLARLIAAGTAINGLAYSPNQQHLLTAGANGKVTFWNLANGNADRTYQGDEKGGATSVAVMRNSILIAVGGGDKKVNLVGYTDAKLVSTFTSPAVTKTLAFSPDNQALIAGGSDGSLTTYDVAHQQGQPPPAAFGNVLQSSAHGATAYDVSFPSQGAVYYTAGADKTVKAWKVASDGPTRNLQHPQSVNCVAYNKDGSLLATGGADGRLRIWELAKGTLVRDVNAHPPMNNQSYPIYCVAFSPDDKTVISGSIDQTLKLWNVADGKMVKAFEAYDEKKFPKGHQEAVLSVAFSPDGKQIASGSMDRTIKIWNVADGTVAKELTNPAYKPEVKEAIWASHPGWVYGLRYVNGGKKLISAGQAPKLKGYLATWDPATGKLLSGKELSYGSVFALATSADEKFIALATGGSVRSGDELNLGVVLKMPE